MILIYFQGKDASLAFVTGDFTESGQTDDVSSLSPSQVMALYDWLAFYQREYQAVGRVSVLASYVSLYFYLFPTPTVTLNVKVYMVRSVS